MDQTLPRVRVIDADRKPCNLSSKVSQMIYSGMGDLFVIAKINM